MRECNSSPSFRIKRQCPTCPWRKQAQLQRFNLARFFALEPSIRQGFGALFACHETPEGREAACVGYLHNQTRPDGTGPMNFHLRMALATDRFDPEALQVVGEQYPSFEQMVAANARGEL
jgi:hypothetical protein